MPPGRRSKRHAYLHALCRVVPDHIVEAVLAEPSDDAVSSQVWQGSVVVADLVGFTALCQRLAGQGPTGLGRLSAILSTLFDELFREAVLPYGGYVVQLGGDSITAAFHGPDDGRRAAACALAAQRVMFGEVGRLLEGQSRDLMLRVGVAGGEVRLTVLGDLSRRAVVCAGTAAERALQLQLQAEPNTVLVDATTATAIAAHAELVDRQEERSVLRGLRKWPDGKKGRRRFGDTSHQVERKIELLEPFVPANLQMRLQEVYGRDEIEGELRPVVAVMVQVAGLDRADVTDSVASSLSRSLLRAFSKYGGVASRSEIVEGGQRVLVLFGLHRPIANEAERALLASLETMDRMRAIAGSTAEGLDVRIAVHSGKAFFGPVGGAQRFELTAVGDPITIAARSAALAEPFSVVATTSLLKHLRRQFDVERTKIELEWTTNQRIALRRVVGVKLGEARYVQQRRQPRFVAGRHEEREKLQTWCDEALAGSGRIASIVGEVGIGKSYLLSGLFDRWLSAGGGAVLSRCRYATKSVPLAPVV